MNSLELKLETFNEINIGIDVGGTLAKFVIISNIINKGMISEFVESFEELILFQNHVLYLKIFNTIDFEVEVVNKLIQMKTKYNNLLKINMTGGGSHKYSSLIEEKTLLKIDKRDELVSLVRGYIFMNNYKTFYQQKKGKIEFAEEKDFTYPHISVNIGSGISILRVNSQNEIKRETGTLIGGGTLIGLSKIILGIDNFDDIMKLAEKGENNNLDLVIKDVYGGSAKNLDENVVASSFSKIGDFNFNDKSSSKKEDIAKSLLMMICFNVGQLAYLVGKANNINRIYVFGNFTRRFSYATECLDYGITFWNKDFEVYFNKYDGYLGSIGCLLENC